MANPSLRYSHIANHCNMPRPAVSIFRRRRLTPTRTIQKRNRKDKLSERNVRSLLKYALNSLFKPLHTIVAEFTGYIGMEIGKNDAKEYLNQRGIQSYGAVSKPYLSAMHMMQGWIGRLQMMQTI